MSQDVHSLTVALPLVSFGTVAAGTARSVLLKVPGTAIGGGISLVSAAYSANAAIAAGSAPAFKLVTLTSTGAVIATIGANGSAALSAGTPVAGTISTYFIPGTVGYLGVEVGQGAYGAATTVNAYAHINYVLGRADA